MTTTNTASDILNKEEIAFTKGSVYDAIRASIAIPTVLTPVKFENRLLVDGGVLNNIPVNHAKRKNGDLLVVVNVNANIPIDKPIISKEVTKEKQFIYQQKIKEFYHQLQNINPLNKTEHIGYFDLLTKTLNLMMYQMAQMSLEMYSPDILINISRSSCNTFDFYKAEEMVEIGKHAASKSIINFQNKSV